MEAQFTEAKMVTDSEGSWLAIRLPRNEILGFLETKRTRKYTCTIKEFRNKRSLDANAYMWVMVGKIAAAILNTPEEVYKGYIRDVGDNYEIFPVRNEIASVFPDIWAKDHIGWIAEDIGKSKIPGYTNFRCYYGSSMYDTKQMSRLIDLVVQDCKELGIETLSEMELSRLKEEWN